jgi:hypothetical protein
LSFVVPRQIEDTIGFARERPIIEWCQYLGSRAGRRCPPRPYFYHLLSSNDVVMAVVKEERSLLIVTGPMRSGTTLIGNMLHGGATYRHPNLSFLPDTHTEIRDLSIACADGLKTPLMNPGLPERYFETWRSMAPRVLSGFERKALLSAPAPDARVFGVKLTCLLPEIQALRSSVYRPKFVIMTRDPRDVFASALRRYGNIQEAPHLAFMNAAFAIDYQRMGSSPDVLTVSYERLVADPRDQLSKVLRFAGLDPDSYDWSSLDGQLMTNSSFQGIGPNDALTGVGIRPSIGNYSTLDKFYRNALAEVFRLERSPPLKTRLSLHEEFLAQVVEIGNRYGYRMAGLQSVLDERNGLLLSLAKRMHDLLKARRN